MSQSEFSDFDPTREYKKGEMHGFCTIHHPEPENIGN